MLDRSAGSFSTGFAIKEKTPGPLPHTSSSPGSISWFCVALRNLRGTSLFFKRSRSAVESDSWASGRPGPQEGRSDRESVNKASVSHPCNPKGFFSRQRRSRVSSVFFFHISRKRIEAFSKTARSSTELARWLFGGRLRRCRTIKLSDFGLAVRLPRRGAVKGAGGGGYSVVALWDQRRVKIQALLLLFIWHQCDSFRRAPLNLPSPCA